MQDGAFRIIPWPVGVRAERGVEAGAHATALRLEVVRLQRRAARFDRTSQVESGHGKIWIALQVMEELSHSRFT